MEANTILLPLCFHKRPMRPTERRERLATLCRLVYIRSFRTLFYLHFQAIDNEEFSCVVEGVEGKSRLF